jgi:paraquat-inducible protein B
MAKRTNPKLIGGFVVGALLLTIIGVLAFGGGEFLKPKAKAVIFFQGSLGGLDVGAPVTFRGVKVGTVTNIVIEYDIANQVMHIPVYFELELEKFQIVSGRRDPLKNMDALIARGLRGQLETLSMVTGQTSINFDFHPETPVRMLGFKKGIQEFPSIPSSMAQLTASVSGVLQKLSSLPLDQIATQITSTIEAAHKVLSDADNVVSGAGGLMASVNTQVKPLSDSLIGTSNQANLTLQEARKRLELREGEPMQNLNQTLVSSRELMNSLNRSLPQFIADARPVMAKAARALDAAYLTLQTAQRVIGPDSPLLYELNSTLRELKAAVTAVRIFAEYIQRNPNALLTGNH